MRPPAQLEGLEGCAAHRALSLPRSARKPLTPSQPIAVPSVSEIAVRTKCTTKNACGRLPVNALGSLAMLRMNVGQITQDHTPNASRNKDQRRLKVMRPL
jgi:hypothetical protein